MRVFRYHYEDGRKDFPQKRFRDGGWEWGSPPPQDRPLYLLPTVLAQVAKGGTVYVVEGEKDVETLEGLGAVATTNPGGAGKWLPHHTECLAGATVVVIADKDEVGVDHALHVARELRATGSAVEVLQPAIGKDVSDHVGAGLDRADLQIVAGGVGDSYTKFVEELVELLEGFDPTLHPRVRLERAEAVFAEMAEDFRQALPTDFMADPHQIRMKLRAWQRDKAREEGVPPHWTYREVHLQDRTVEELVARRPRTRRELLRVWGIGPVRADLYGDELLTILWGDPD